MFDSGAQKVKIVTINNNTLSALERLIGRMRVRDAKLFGFAS
jgi:hypothetical protein